MNKIIFQILVMIFLIQCQNPEPLAPNLHFTIDHFDVSNNQMEVTINLTNSSEDIWQGGQWSLHWNQFSGAIQPQSLPKDIKILPTKNSQYWQLQFGPSHTLNPGDSMTFSIIQSGIMSRLVMGPIGFFVHDKITDRLVDLSSQINWKNAKGVNDLNLPSAADRYAAYQGISKKPKTELHWILPTPKKIESDNRYRAFPKFLNIDFGDYKKQGDSLTSHLQNGLKLKLTQDEEQEVHIKVKNDESIDKEAYQLSITEESIKITVSDYNGLFYAFKSLHQILLLAQKEDNRIPLLSVEDSPRFRHRGFMIDLSRNFYPKEKILEILDYMAFYKLNILDVKLSDDEGWRIEIPGLKELTEIGSNRGFTKDEKDRLFPMYGSGSGIKQNTGSGYLSRKDFIEILQVASLKNIRVVPQISFPSHARAAVIAMKARYEKYLEKGDLVAANEYRLHDPNDQSEYTSAQLFKDNTICICEPGAFRFFEKIFMEIKAMYAEADLPLETFNIGADELPYGVWRKSPICEEFIRKSPSINSYQSLYDQSVKRLNKIIAASGAKMAGWEDVLLTHSKKSQSEVEVNKNLINLDFIPSVWNNTWGGGREDMIYKLTNLGFKSVMSNSSAFYFDMTDDADMENSGLSWSGYVSYKDSWGTEPLDVFANKVKLNELGINGEKLANKVSIQDNARDNFLGIQSQLWTETATSKYEFDRMLMPNMIVFAERAWSPKEDWIEETTADAQAPKLDKRWNTFVNTIGQRHLPLLSQLYNDLAYDLPKPGGVIKNNILKIRQQFPGLEIRYTKNGTIPTSNDFLYTEAITVRPSDQIVVRVFDPNGRGGNAIKIQ